MSADFTQKKYPRIVGKEPRTVTGYVKSVPMVRVNMVSIFDGILFTFVTLIFTRPLLSSTSMLDPFAAVLLLGGIGAAMGIGMLIVPLIFAPRKPNPVKSETFDCGQVPVGEARVRVVMRYYPYLLMFAIFDVMSFFLFAWGVNYRQYAGAASIPVLIFIAVLTIALGRALTLARRRKSW